MEPELFAKLNLLPSLLAGGHIAKPCKICGSSATFFDVVDLNKCCGSNFYQFGPSHISVEYYKCSRCSFIFTTFFDSWTADDFSRFIYNADYGVVDPEYDGTRSRQLAEPLADLLAGCGEARLLDYGSGAGHLAAEMKARGFHHVSEYDPFSAPQKPEDKFDIITCIEVIEHSVDPLATVQEIKRLMADDGGIVFTQSLQPPNIDELRANWWYVGPRNGHVSIFATDSLGEIADKSELVFHSGLFHGFTTEKASSTIQNVMARVGPEVGRSVRLYAPYNDDHGWHSLEVASPHMRFRWTSSSEISWPPQRCRPGIVEIRIPFTMEVTPTFSSRCKIFAGETECQVEVKGQEIIAHLECTTAVNLPVKLVTPSPISPYALSGAPDHRTLGLAIPVT